MSNKLHLVRPLGYMLASTSLLSMLLMPATQALAEPGNAGSNAVTSSTNRSDAPVPQTKRETVVTTTDSTGNIRSIQVNTVLETNGNHDVADTSKLQRLTTSDPKITATTEGALVWHTEDGRNITYSATANTAPPVAVKVSYTLDGEAISPHDLPGSNGHVTIRYDYLDSSKTATGYSPYTPFIAVTSVPLDGEIFTNIQVTNGELVTESGKLMAYGCGLTGVQSTDDVPMPTYFEISADVHGFQLEQATSILTSQPLSILYGEAKTMTGVSQSTLLALDEYLKKLEELRTHTEEVRNDADNLASNLSIVANVTSQLGYAASELDTNRNKIDAIGSSADNVIGQSMNAASAAQSFIDSVYAMDGLSYDQKEEIVALWDANGVSSAIAQVSSEAQSLKSATDGLDFSSTMQASIDLQGIDFSTMSQSAYNLRDKLNDMLEVEFGALDAEDEETIFGRTAKLKKDLESGGSSDEASLPKTLAAGLSTDVLALVPQVEEQDDSGTQTPGVTATVTRRSTGNVLAEVTAKIDSAISELAGEQSSTSQTSKDPYTNYGGILDGTVGTVQFVFNTAAIK